MAGLRRWPSMLLLVVLGTATASEFQVPLVSQQESLNAESTIAKPLVNTSDLQASIKIENLVQHAKDLFILAQLSEPEFGHPTRVIGSDGM